MILLLTALKSSAHTAKWSVANAFGEVSAMCTRHTERVESEGDLLSEIYHHPTYNILLIRRLCSHAVGMSLRSGVGIKWLMRASGLHCAVTAPADAVPVVSCLMVTPGTWSQTCL